jgi:asparagine synthase (glutamine-hydrolysing)
MREAMLARGPDGAGLWQSPDGRIGLAHRRLSIIDLSDAGAQPMASADGGLRITFNGEIYNYRELRRELESKGRRFETQSDTEVLLHLYADRGPDMVQALRGMYAFGIWDERSKGIFLARDPFGIKPLYYVDDGKSIRFASQVKALLAGGAVNREVDPAGHVGFLIWGSVPEPHTLFKAVRAVASGTTLWIDQSGRRVERVFFDISREFAAAERQGTDQSDAEATRVVMDALDQSVRRHLVADVPVGVFLSSGLDSTALTAMAAKSATEPLRTITMGFKEYVGTVNDETPLARRVADRHACRHTESWVSEEDFRHGLDLFLGAMDQPTIDGANVFLVSRQAALAGLKVAISGVGGDELLGGYPSFAEIPHAAAILPSLARVPGLGVGFRRAASMILGRIGSPKYAGLIEYGWDIAQIYLLRRALFMPWELAGAMDPDLAHAGWRDLHAVERLYKTTSGLKSDFLKISALEMTHYMRNQLLRDADWAGMAHSLEIRVPFLDVDLLRAVALASTRTKVSRRNLFRDIHDAETAKSIFGRRKTGFMVPLRQWAGDVAAPDSSRNRGLRGWGLAVHARFK